MMRFAREILSSANFCPNPSRIFGESLEANWSLEENKKFEDALAFYDKDTPDRWQKVAARIPGKSEVDVRRHYEDLETDVSGIEAGLFPFPGYDTSTFALDFANNKNLETLKSPYAVVGGRRTAARPDHERKKGVPWTEHEHKMFLLGLQRYGKGDWRNISRHYVLTRTPTQVASHAQKYYIRQLSVGKDKRRSSIHDITTVNFTESRPPSPSQDTNVPTGTAAATASRTPEHFSLLYNSCQSNNGAVVFSPTSAQVHENLFNSLYGIKLQTQSFQRGRFHESQVSQLHASRHGSHG